MSTDNHKENKVISMTKFPHNLDTPRATRWRDWVKKLRFTFGSIFPLLADQLSDPINPLDYWWGLTWKPLYDFTHMSAQEEQKLYAEFQKAQYSILHVISENFYQQEKQLIINHEPCVLKKKLQDLYSPKWDKDLEFLP